MNMKKIARILALLAAAATLGLGMSSCDYWDSDWYKEGGGSGNSTAPSSSSSSSSSTGTSGSGAALFWDGWLHLKKEGSSSPAAGITEYRFTASTRTGTTTFDTSDDVTSLCGTHRWYIGGEVETDPNPYTEFEMDGGHVDQLFYKYKEITVPGITVTPSADTRSCTVTVNSAELPSWSERPNDISIVVVDWTTPQGMTGSDNVNSDTFEMKKANYDNDIVYSDWGISRPIVDIQYNSERSASISYITGVGFY